MNTFFELIQVAIGNREEMSAVPQSREEWNDLMTVASQHNLLGITFPVIDEFHDKYDVPLGIYTRWAMAAEKLKDRNRAFQQACIHLHAKFLESGFRVCVMKGQAAAALYPNPDLRHCGDIDLWAEGGREKVMTFLKSRFPLRKILYIHADVQMLKGINTEVHFTPSWLNSPLGNKRLQQYFKAKEKEQFGNFRPELGFCTLTLGFNVVYMLQHIYRHVLEAGIGLRQLLDYYYLLKALPESEKDAAVQDLEQLKMEGFAAGVMYVLQEAFCMERKDMIVEPDPVLGSFLLGEIMLSGNFGRYDPRNTKGKGRISHIASKITRALRFLRYFPSEVLWMPWFMTWQYFWRRKHNYLYKGR